MGMRAHQGDEVVQKGRMAERVESAPVETVATLTDGTQHEAV